jgi:hypothetical protein
MQANSLREDIIEPIREARELILLAFAQGEMNDLALADAMRAVLKLDLAVGNLELEVASIEKPNGSDVSRVVRADEVSQ